MRWTVYNNKVFNLDKVTNFSINQEYGNEQWTLTAMFGIGGFWEAEERDSIHAVDLGRFDSEFEAQIAVREIINDVYSINKTNFGVVEEPPDNEMPHSDAVDDQDGASELPTNKPDEDDIPF